MTPKPIVTSAEIGLAFCGMVEDAPRYMPSSSATSPTSVRERSTTSRASLMQLPEICAATPANSAIPSRATCHGTATGSRSSRRASAVRTTSARSASAADVPPAPNSETTAIADRARPSRARCRVNSARKTAHLAPNVVGTACWAWVRPAITVSACRSTMRASASPTAETSSTRRRPASRSWRDRALSMMSCVVAPKWTQPASSGSSAAQIIRTSGRIGYPTMAASDHSTSRSMTPGLQAAAMRSAVAPSMTPASASA